VHVPGLDGACAAADAHELLGRKGLLYKEPATRLALCAVQRALGLPAGSRQQGAPDPRTAVVASSNLGNVATVRKIVATLRDGVGKDVSPLDAPNASSNVIASTVAIWFRLGGPSLMVCSGSTSGLDAVAAATLLLRSGRADRVVVVGAEPDDDTARLLRGDLRAGAAAVVLERPNGGARVRLGPVRSGHDVDAPVVVGPAEVAPAGCTVIDVTAAAGDFYGALGVLQVALAAGLAEDADEVAAVCGDPVDGWRTVTVTA
jgi:3-oxoacyl-[acyl-carrier-protein] synthase II